MGLGRFKRMRRRSSSTPNESTDQNHRRHSQLRVGMLGGPHHPKVAKEQFQRRGIPRSFNSTRNKEKRTPTTSGDQRQLHVANQPPTAIDIPEDVSTRISRLYVRGRVNRQKRHEEEEGVESDNYAYSDTVQRKPRGKNKTQQQEEQSTINDIRPASSPPPSYDTCVELGLFTGIQPPTS